MPSRPNSKLPDMGEWQVVSGFISSDAPFGIVHVDFGPTASGWVRWRDRTSQLSHISEFADDQFNAIYDMWGHKGSFEGTIREDQTLELIFLETKHQKALTCRTVVLDVKSKNFSLKVSNMSPGDKLAEVLTRSLLLMPAGVAEQIKGLIQPQALIAIGGILTIWGASHFLGVGEVADVVLLLLGGVVLGSTALDIAEELLEFARMMHGARSEEALNESAKHFARAVSIGSVNVVIAILMGKAPKILREVYPGNKKDLMPPVFRTAKGTAAEFTPAEAGPRLAFEIRQGSVRAPTVDPVLEAAQWRAGGQPIPQRGFPWKPSENAEINEILRAIGGEPGGPPLLKQPTGVRQRVGPVWDPVKEPLENTPGRWFFQPRAYNVQAFENAAQRGATTVSGERKILNSLSGFERYKVIAHEGMHQWLTPRLQVLREIRIQAGRGAYSRSYILRYIEEALAETRGKLTQAYLESNAKGALEALPSAFKFPVKNGYVTVARVGEEVRGILQGPILVGGVTYQVWFEPGTDEQDEPR